MDEQPSSNPRRLLVFAPAGTSPYLTRQREALSGEEEEISDRDLGVEYFTGPANPDPRDEDLRRRYGVGQRDFAALLIGRDGGVKLRSPEPLTAKELFGRIDEMPLRRREVCEARERGDT